MRAYGIITIILLFMPVAGQAQEQAEDPLQSTTILEAGFGWKASELGINWNTGTTFRFRVPDKDPSFYVTWYPAGKLLIEPQIEFFASTASKTFNFNVSGQFGVLINVRGRYPLYTSLIVKDFVTWKSGPTEDAQVDIGRYGLGLGYRVDVGDMWSLRPELSLETYNISQNLYIQIRLAIGGILIRK